jgi:hypothetical protein
MKIENTSMPEANAPSTLKKKLEEEKTRGCT